MGLKLTIRSPLGYVKAVSGLFITKDSPTGLTTKEMLVISKLVEYSNNGAITFGARRKTTENLDIKKQDFYNTLVILRKKGVIVEDELHRIFTSNSLTVNYASNS